ncbi:MAG: cell division ATPase MinD [Nanoarchaeota archaeon]
MSRLIVITSGKGGVGKTTTAINLGAALNYFGEDVLVIDANLSTPNIGVHLNSPEVPVDLNKVLQDKARPIEAVYRHESGMKIMPSSLSMKELRKIKPEKLKTLKGEFKRLSDYIIVDCAAGLGHEATGVIEMADEIIIVTNPELPAITDALKAVKLAEELKKPVIGVIVTRVRKDDLEMQPDNVKEMLEVPILGMVPEHKDIKRALNLRDAVVHTHPKSIPARAYKEIAARILNIDYDSDADKEKVYEFILRKLGLKK